MTALSSAAPVLLTYEHMPLDVWTEIERAFSYIGLSINTFEREEF
jgi:hypothetical protein